MASNAKLSSRALPEDDARLLEDTAFPCLFGYGCDPGAPVAPIDLDADVAGADGETPEARIARSAARCRDLSLWLQGIGTPYGYYQYQAVRAQSRLLQSAILRITTRHEDFGFEIPIYPWYAEHDEEWADVARAAPESSSATTVLLKSMRTWTSLDNGIGMLAGTATLRLRSARSPMVLLHKWVGGKEELAIALHQGASPEEPACPVEEGLPIGGNALMRNASRAASLLCVLRAEEAAGAADKELDLTPLYRGSRFDLRTLAMYDEKLVGRRPRNEASLLTALAASDLALFTPLHPCFDSLRRGMRWNDLHPGHRYRRILEVVKERGLSLKEPDSWAYWRFTSAISEALKWPEVPRFLDTALARVEASDDDQLARLYRAACEAREANPCAFVDPFLAAERLTHLAPPFFAEPGSEGPVDADLALFFAIEGELYALGFQLLFGEEKPRFLLDCFKPVRGLLDSPAEMVTRYFGLALES